MIDCGENGENKKARPGPHRQGTGPIFLFLRRNRPEKHEKEVILHTSGVCCGAQCNIALICVCVVSPVFMPLRCADSVFVCVVSRARRGVLFCARVPCGH